MRRVTLLAVDAAINLILGVVLMAFPDRLVALLGVPPAPGRFYPSLLGGVLFGIGIALLIERRHGAGNGNGLGLAGAVAINLCGGLVLGFWLVSGAVSLPMRGVLFLGAIVLLLLGLSMAELARGGWRR
ncbi:hypothetical protein DSCA_05800 [Desulfosarcina alkanivorans]|uniref:Uncharacterized protein n=1 Tax=Desulfosarcina alkanivorans TaxID=571177 RepID=A0A5K7YF47_9BACT|nr:hypothetical protein [Desulfosarcina alkanivorans]BBO66650.1 hypothetical protein DSCA_05800 [Desulfosarcina alkanivorans]